jgi:L-fuculose-phosphate aldolase
MDIKDMRDLLLRRSNSFHDRYFKAYGQIMARVDGETYMMSSENLLLSDLEEEDFKLYDINVGDIGAIFMERGDINAIVFACTEPSVVYSSRSDLMQPALDDLAQIIGQDVRTAATGTARDILPALKGRNGCYIKGAGSFGVGSTIEEAIAAVRILEKSAEVEVFGDVLGGVHRLDPETAGRLSDYYDSSYSKVNSEAHVNFVNIGEEEFSLRSALIDCGKELCRRELVQGTWGNISLRLNDHEMLITPSGMDYFSIRIEDIVRLDINDPDPGSQRRPSSEFRMHAGIYRSHPEISAVVHTHSNGLSVFAAANAGFRITDPLLHETIGDVLVSRYEFPGTDELTEAVLEQLADSRACIVANHGAVFTGNSLDQVLAAADAIESKACNLLGFDRPIEHDEDKEGDGSSEAAGKGEKQ